MSYSLALNAPEVFKKAAVVSGLISEFDWNHRSNGKPISIMHIHGNEDEVIEIEKSEHYQMSVAEIIGFFKEMNRSTKSETEKLGNDTTIYRYSSDNNDYSVWYYMINDWGHEWPTRNESDFDAAQAIWEFFNQ